MPKKRDDRVGRGKPPKHSQFAPGQSGNPKGRPRGSGSIWTEIDKELGRRVPISENGRSKRITKQRAAAAQIVNAAAKGDLKALTQLLKREKAGEDSRTTAKDGIFESDDHQLTLKNIVRRIRAMDPEPDPTDSGNDDSKEKGEDDEP